VLFALVLAQRTLSVARSITIGARGLLASATSGRSISGHVRDRFHSLLTADHVSHQGVRGR
jgi:hypothetical protein